MTEDQALQLQKWCFYNLKINLALKEREGDNWFVIIGLPNGARERLYRGYFRMAVAYDLSTPSPHAANLGLMIPRSQYPCCDRSQHRLPQGRDPPCRV